MERLHIPLGSSPIATRRPRWVVWLLGVVALFLLVFVGTNWWFGRADIGRAAPDGTDIVVRLQPGPSAWQNVIQTLGNIPAVSGRGLTLKDLAPSIQGEFAFFVNSDGSWSLGIRSSTKLLPQAMLDAQGISVQNAGSGLYLLSNSTQSIVPLRLPSPSFWQRDWFGPTIGTVYVQNDTGWIAGRLQTEKIGWNMTFPKMVAASFPWKNLPTGTIAALATPTFSKTLDFSQGAATLDDFLKNFNIPSFQGITSDLLQKQGLVLLTKDASGSGFLLAGPASSISQSDGQQLIAMASALQNPQTQSWTLPDATTAEEIIADPSATTINQKTINGTNVLETKAGVDNSFLFAQNKNQYALSNRNDLLTYWLDGGTTGSSLSTDCPHANGLFVSLPDISTLAQSDVTSESTNLVQMISSHFTDIGMKNSLITSSITFCY